MSSGQKSIVINNAERAVSTDINRLQSFQTKGAMEAARYTMNVQYSNRGILASDGASLNQSDDVGAASVGTELSTTGTPLQGEILGGLCVIPQVGSLALGVTAGILFAIFPDTYPSTDDSNYKYVKDAGGVPVLGGLVMTANLSGSIRIDVIECQPQPDPNPEVDNRDIFNPVTGLFTASTIPKSTGDTLAYRVRAGSPGAGYPGPVPGWMPLCIASVPAGATTNDTITFWDVRPLASDRVFGAGNIARDMPAVKALTYSMAVEPGATNGIVEIEFNNARAGGRLQRGSPGTDFQYCDFADTSNQEAGLSLTATDPALIYLYLGFPFGLPRWARYTDANDPRGRVPRNPRGIPILSKAAPVHVYGTNSRTIVLPSIFGFAGAAIDTGAAVCFGATTYESGALNSVTCSRGIQDVNTAVNPATDTVLQYSGTITMQENVHWPAGATRIRGIFQIPLALTGGGGITNKWEFIPTLTLQIAGFTSYQASTVTLDAQPWAVVPGMPALPYYATWYFELSVPNLYPETPTDPTYQLVYNVDIEGGGEPPTPSTVVNVQITGWEFGK